MTALWFLLYIFIGLVVGILSGIFGIGGGVVLVPVLTWCGFKIEKAVGTSLCVVPLFGLPGAWRAFQDGRVDLQAAITIGIAFAVGAYFGASVVKELDRQLLMVAFGVFLLFIAVRFIFSGRDEVVLAVSGLTASALALVAYFGLYLLGRRYMSPPNLAEKIRTSQEEGITDPEYYI
jgi:uncharacterized membrane protein YfcA